MAHIDESFRDYLLFDTAIVLLISDRLYPEILPQDVVLPAITFTTISSQHPENVDGTTGLRSGSYQLSCWADTPKIAAELAALVIARMQGIGGNGFQKNSVDDERSDYENDTKRYRRDVDVQIAFA